MSTPKWHARARKAGWLPYKEWLDTALKYHHYWVATPRYFYSKKESGREWDIALKYWIYPNILDNDYWVFPEPAAKPFAPWRTDNE